MVIASEACLTGVFALVHVFLEQCCGAEASFAFSAGKDGPFCARVTLYMALKSAREKCYRSRNRYS